MQLDSPYSKKKIVKMFWSKLLSTEHVPICSVLYLDCPGDPELPAQGGQAHQLQLHHLGQEEAPEPGSSSCQSQGAMNQNIW